MTTTRNQEPSIVGTEAFADSAMAYEIIHGKYELRIAAVNDAYNQAEPGSETALVCERMLDDLVRARDLLSPSMPDTLELGRLFIDRMELPKV